MMRIYGGKVSEAMSVDDINLKTDYSNVQFTGEVFSHFHICLYCRRYNKPDSTRAGIDKKNYLKLRPYF